MPCCNHCIGVENNFNTRRSTRELKRFRKKGPSETTKALVNAIVSRGIQGASLLDIGGGVGAIQHLLFEAGIGQVTGVDASTANVKAASDEHKRRGTLDRVKTHFGDFVDLAPSIRSGDIVTLDRVLCCYPDMRSLVDLSTERSNRMYGLVYPRKRWWLNGIFALINMAFWLTRDSFRVFIHDPEAVDSLIRNNGFKLEFADQTMMWQVAVYVRRME